MSLSPALQAPGLWERKVMGRQGPAPKSERAEGRPPPRTPPPHQHFCPGQVAHSSKGAGVMDTFMIEKQLEWRQERHTIIWAESVGGRV